MASPAQRAAARRRNIRRAKAKRTIRIAKAKRTRTALRRQGSKLKRQRRR
jgi:hypothetical protein